MPPVYHHYGESPRATAHTIRALRAGHHDTVEVPVISMAELVESQRCP